MTLTKHKTSFISPFGILKTETYLKLYGYRGFPVQVHFECLNLDVTSVLQVYYSIDLEY